MRQTTKYFSSHNIEYVTYMCIYGILIYTNPTVYQTILTKIKKMNI